MRNRREFAIDMTDPRAGNVDHPTPTLPQLTPYKAIGRGGYDDVSEKFGHRKNLSKNGKFHPKKPLIAWKIPQKKIVFHGKFHKNMDPWKIPIEKNSGNFHASKMILEKNAKT